MTEVVLLADVAGKLMIFPALLRLGLAGMYFKGGRELRPLVVAEGFVLTGFKEKEWEEKLTS